MEYGRWKIEDGRLKIEMLEDCWRKLKIEDGRWKIDGLNERLRRLD
jgi:hypothetical protein